jgi:hypothetical protein
MYCSPGSSTGGSKTARPRQALWSLGLAAITMPLGSALTQPLAR